MFKFAYKIVLTVAPICLLGNIQVVRSQNFADKNFYLVDSLDLESLSESDRTLLDTSLVLYHATIDDTIELEILEHIVDNCWGPEVWPKYNALLIKIILEKLTYTNDPEISNRFLYFLGGGVSNIGYLYDEQGDFLNALKYYHRSLDLYERGNHRSGAATTFNNLGVLYSVIGDTTKALEYHQKSLKAKKDIGDMRGVAMSYNNIGTLYELHKENFVALEYYEASLKISLELGDQRGIAMAYDNIGDIYFREEFYAKALTFYQKGNKEWELAGIQTGISTNLNSMSNAHMKLGHFEKAKEYGIKSFEIATKIGYPVDIENSSRSLIEIFKQEKDFETALKYSEIYISTRDQIRSTENAKSAVKNSMQYEYKRLALADSLEHEKENAVQNLRIQEQETQAYALSGGIVLMLIAFVFGIRSYRIKRKDNEKINEQKKEVESQKEEIEKQHIALANTHKEISDSISYAKRIQDAILPSPDSLISLMNEVFVLFLPKDVVSGDFYWLVKKDDLVMLAVADCTGHGVPGAMVSVVCHKTLNQVVGEFKLTEPNLILDKTRELIIETFASKGENVKDGMDISLCTWNSKTKQLKWAGAYNPLYILRQDKKEIEIIAADKQPIGKFEMAQNFTGHELFLEAGDQFYLFTDGLADQFGGPDQKKFKYAKMRNLLIENSHRSMEEQGALLEKEFVSWKGDLEQIDDICFIGVRV